MTGQTKFDSWQADWVENHLGIMLPDIGRKAVHLLCAAKGCGPYDFVSTFRRADWRHGVGVSLVINGELATWDSNGLSALVIGAHDLCVRVAIEGCGPRLMRVSMWQREGRDGPIHKRHPTMEQAAALVRGSASVEAQGAVGETAA